MRNLLICLCAALLALCLANAAVADSVNLYVDAAPNVYGSPDYAPWEADAFSAAASGTFVNMGNSTNPDNAGTTNFEIEDEVVYSFGDLGKRLTFIYWIPGETVENLADNALFQVSLVNVWDGDTSDFYDDYYGTTWLEPSKWEDYDSDGDTVPDGVIGTGGMAWWGAYNTNTQEELDADVAEWGGVQEDWIFTAKLDGEEYSITAHRRGPDTVPLPGTVILFGSGLAGLVGIRRRFKKR